jgi:hypothetical protein
MYQEIRNASGRVCCAGDRKDFCETCKARAAGRSAPNFSVGDRVVVDSADDDADGATGVIAGAEDGAYSVEEAGEVLGIFDESELRGAGAAAEPPDGYALALGKVMRQAEAADDSVYEPFGEPPDGYAIAIARQGGRR